eukprot:TRINITY_DN6270_c0_g1_i1.p1 TRINITY_DN6270_c0_g1~~TRINITY_DN6270_c0_g1_i1.p1  ORF type:complete len:465 (-),score=58.93 TRINITY_DN6270_c0_g1_i1:25-1419(-)
MNNAHLPRKASELGSEVLIPELFAWEQMLGISNNETLNKIDVAVLQSKFADEQLAGVVRTLKKRAYVDKETRELISRVPVLMKQLGHQSSEFDPELPARLLPQRPKGSRYPHVSDEDYVLSIRVIEGLRKALEQWRTTKPEQVDFIDPVAGGIRKDIRCEVMNDAFLCRWDTLKQVLRVYIGNPDREEKVARVEALLREKKVPFKISKKDLGPPPSSYEGTNSMTREPGFIVLTGQALRNIAGVLDVPKDRPLLGTLGSGTVGGVIKIKQDTEWCYYALTNAHVVYNGIVSNRLGFDSEDVGWLNSNRTWLSYTPEVDAALVKLTSNDVTDLDKLQGVFGEFDVPDSVVTDSIKGAEVVKYGNVTGITFGTFAGCGDATIAKGQLPGQVLVEHSPGTKFADNGDSGSVNMKKQENALVPISLHRSRGKGGEGFELYVSCSLFSTLQTLGERMGLDFLEGAKIIV